MDKRGRISHSQPVLHSPATNLVSRVEGSREGTLELNQSPLTNAACSSLAVLHPWAPTKEGLKNYSRRTHLKGRETCSQGVRLFDWK
jgi:hypothetical protein